MRTLLFGTHALGLKTESRQRARAAARQMQTAARCRWARLERRERRAAADRIQADGHRALHRLRFVRLRAAAIVFQAAERRRIARLSYARMRADLRSPLLRLYGQVQHERQELATERAARQAAEAEVQQLRQSTQQLEQTGQQDRQTIEQLRAEDAWMHGCMDACYSEGEVAMAICELRAEGHLECPNCFRPLPNINDPDFALDENGNGCRPDGV